MEQNFFTNLPSDITSDILSRLSHQSISISKCVCKPWLNLLESEDFKMKILPALVYASTTWCMAFDIEDKADLERHHLHYNRLTQFKPSSDYLMVGVTSNGSLLLFVHQAITHYTLIRLCICNPITREHVYLYPPDRDAGYNSWSFGFGLSKISGQHKVVYIRPDIGIHHVYTLGTESWRGLESGCPSGLIPRYMYAECAFNGNPHWILDDLSRVWICGFDAETECFSIFSPPMIEIVGELSVLRNCLCYSYTDVEDMDIWLMKEYQVEESWTILYKLSHQPDLNNFLMMFPRPIIIFKDGDILMEVDRLIYYSNKTRSTHKGDMFKETYGCRAFATTFTPNLLSLKSFGFQNVRVYDHFPYSNNVDDDMPMFGGSGLPWLGMVYDHFPYSNNVADDMPMFGGSGLP